MSLEAHDYTIYDLLKDKSFIIPENQRKYVWDKNNWEELFDDIKLVYSEKVNDHFIGSVVLKEENIKDGIKKHYLVIDGQQRISTITIIFCVLAFIYAENNDLQRYNGLEKQLFVTDNKSVRHPMMSKKANKDIEKVINMLYEDDLSIKIQNGMVLLSPQSYLDLAKVSKKVTDCFMYFYNSITSLCKNSVEEIEKIQTIITDIKYIDIVAKNDEDAFTIFEILNARGKPLTDFELLRNFLLKYTKKDGKESIIYELESLGKRLGDSTEVFLKHYAMHRYGRKTDKSENRPFKVIAKEEKDRSKEDLLRDLIKKSEYYEKMINFCGCSDLEKKIFTFFKQRRQQQYRPIILGLMHQQELGNLDNENYNKYISYLYSFFICYNVIGEQTSNKIEDIVEGYSKKIENSFSIDVLKNMKISMVERMPSEKDFKARITHIKYSTGNKAYKDNRKADNIRAIYEVVEKENGYSNEITVNEFNIEHCYSDSKANGNEDYYTVGNLMLLEKDINDQCKNKDLCDKITLYGASKLHCPKTIVDGFSISDRTNNIANILYSYIVRLSND